MTDVAGEAHPPLPSRPVLHLHRGTGTRPRATATRRQAPGTRHQATGNRRQAPGTRRQAPGDGRGATGDGRQAPIVSRGTVSPSTSVSVATRVANAGTSVTDVAGEAHPPLPSHPVLHLHRGTGTRPRATGTRRQATSTRHQAPGNRQRAAGSHAKKGPREAGTLLLGGGGYAASRTNCSSKLMLMSSPRVSPPASRAAFQLTP